jgi:hypothetical protein
MIDALYKCGVSVSYNTLLTCVKSLGENCITLAKELAPLPHSLCWDNFDTQTSIFIEQQTDAPSKVQSGTFAVCYRLKNVDPMKMQLAPILAHLKLAQGLDFDQHVKPTYKQLELMLFQFQVIVVHTLTTYCKLFLEFTDALELQNKL